MPRLTMLSIVTVALTISLTTQTVCSQGAIRMNNQDLIFSMPYDSNTYEWRLYSYQDRFNLDVNRNNAVIYPIFSIDSIGSFTVYNDLKVSENIGVGQSPMEEEIDIYGYAPSIRCSGYNGQTSSLKLLERTNDIYYGFEFQYDGDDDKLHLWSRSFSGNEAIRVTFQKDGNVGIGTENPAGKLDVNGAIYQRGSSLHADYVFEKRSGIATIKEHSRKMWEEKHLPAVPKARIDDNGLEVLEVGAHRKGMLEELEIAHIYIEQLNDRIEKLEKVNAALLQEIKMIIKNQ